MDKRITERISELAVFPIVVLDEATQAVQIGNALKEGGLPCAEFTFRTAAAAEAIRIFSEKFPDMLVGAGTVLTVDQARLAIDAGAEFIVAPGFNPRVVDYCLEWSISIFPGVCTPTDVEMALERGLKVLKFFPAAAIGGVSYLKALSGPFRGVSFIPTGGVNTSNLVEYLSLDNVIACGGSWLAPTQLIRDGNFADISSLARETVQIVRSVR
jgi:2-dehydro-3-deoxyphosphogluconate aldolase/(4S)-4-hydroxy-2-oxoglutarate aldolase